MERLENQLPYFVVEYENVRKIAGLLNGQLLRAYLIVDTILSVLPKTWLQLGTAAVTFYPVS